ncbi:uncharacterized protein adgrf8 isoform X13 [Oncorhynchus mykiss]|uniref:uncharacterized protein adgrf8 isoform X13 n=1 Tax=Oncorhynchus mykiss TaxID=8022 RepID=UPI0018781167|nr:uncharacterized protein adgrf8 isoform X13 [Oncorhynchus mykiss]
MAITKNGLSVLVLLVTCSVLETREFIEISSLFSQGFNTEYNPHLSHVREKRAVLSNRWNYIIDVEVNVSDIKTIEQIKSAVNSTSLPLTINNSTEISAVDITTVCYPYGTGFQCRCEDQYRWSYNNCVTYGSCDDITGDTCGCINANPADGQYCQPYTKPVTLLEYFVEVEVNVNDLKAIDEPKNLLKNLSLPFALSSMINITDINITTVCYPNGTGFQCRCEDQYRWSCNNCAIYGACEENTDKPCSCINAIPSDGEYCQSVQNPNFTACPTTTASPSTVPTVPPTLYEYMIEIEVNTTDVTVIDQLRAILRNAIYPVRINNLNQITGVNMSTVCFPNGTGFQCRCEDQYRWSCDQCVFYGKCDDITSDTCGCINAIPTDGQYCQSVLHQNFTACPTTTASPTTVPTVPPTLYEYMIEIELNTTDVTVIDQLRAILRNAIYPVRINNLNQITGVNMSTVCFPNGTGFQCRCEDQYRWSCDQCVSFGNCDDITSDTCGCINAIPPDGQYCQSVLHQNFTACPTTTASPTTVPTVPPTLYEYMMEIELNTTDVTVIDQLRAILRNAIYPVRINNLTQITGVNMSTVCFPNATGFQCRCEDQYRWSCDQCVSFGNCDDITSDTCGCINAIPPDGEYCQSVLHQNFTACPTTTASPTTVPTVPPTLYEYMMEIEVNTTDVTVIDQLRAILRNAIYPVRINNLTQITGVNMSTVCFPNATGFQCRCEDQYRWSCDQCVSFGNCDDITSDTCGCINAIPTDGQYCQSVLHQNFTACPTTTASPTTVPTVPPTLYEYMIEIELNTTDVTVIDQLRAILRNAIYPVRINNLNQITGVNMSTVCFPNATGFQCRCEDQYRWSCDQCVSYGKCDDITSDTCGCINAIPTDGQYCQSVLHQNFTACPTTTASPTTVPTVPPTLYEYMMEIEVNTTDVTVIDQLRAILRNAIYPVRINNLTQITGVNMSTVCFPNGTGFQCRCEDQYRWSCDQCVSFGNCDDITSDTCGCINAIPPDGQYCQSVLHQNFTACPTTTASPTTVPTVPPTLYEYMIEIELNTTDVTVIDQLRAILRNAIYPVRINNLNQITGVNMSTVCFPNGTGFQCRCEDQYRWSCDQCVSFGNCDDITSDTCGCINAIPTDGQYCQSVHHQNFTACPTTTASPTTVPTVPPTLYEYMIEIEVNTTDVTVIDQLRAILRNAIYPVRINNLNQITGVNMSTVCFPNGTGFQCRCEDQYRWSCDQCVSFGNCDDITSDTCGCINAIPPDGQYCQSVLHQNFTACPTTTASPTTVPTVPPTLYEYMMEIEVNTTDVTVIDQLRAILRNAIYPVRINNLNQITGVNMSTVCFPNGTGFQCRCEDQYRWSCDQCVSYGKCDDITSDTCGCINAIPTDGQYCQSVLHQNFTACPTTTASPTTVPTVPPTLYEYMIEIELNTTDVTVIDQLRAILRNAIYPVRINNLNQITGVNMSTVCFPNGTGFQCRCEDQYHWSCDQCVSFGNCDDITSDTCGCINAIPPDGQYCQSVLHQNFTACPTTTASPTTVPTVPPTLYEYMIEIELNTTDVTVIDQLRAILRNAIYPVRINNLNQITGVNMSTVCFPNGTGFQCRCEDQYRWSCDQCVSFGNCDDITSDTCGCINAIPTDGHYCQSVLHQNFTACPTTTASPTTVPTVPPTLYEYMIEIELNTTDVTVIDQLRAILRNAIYPVRINNLNQITGVNMSTVCFPNGTGFQCRCEDQYRWSCDQCVSFGNCDDITSDTCGCINAIPPDGQYCQSVLQQNFTACPTTTASPTTVPTVPPTLYEYMIEIELNTTDVTVIDQLRAILRNAIYPVRINNLNQITGVNMSTVCFPNGTGFQCRCEDQYRWSCDQCVSYGKCDDITSGTCGCINAIPTDGQYCQSVLHQNFTACPTTTASPTTVPTVPPTLYEYMIEIELNTTDVTVIDQLRAILRNAIYPVRINNLNQITGVNMSTVCFPNGTGFQCRCEDQYRWSCDQCVSYGKCDDITSDTCGCINAIPTDGQYCQSVLHQNFTACPTTTASPTTVPTVPPTLYEYMIEIELNTTDVTVIDQLRAILRNAIYPVRINNLTQITGVNMSTVCFPNATGFQCRCEDQYRWSCDQCVSFGNCDDITSDTCGCINAIPPDGQYCQSVLHQNFTACPTTTASPTTVPTVPPTLYEYMIEIELNTTDVTVIDQLRAILRNAIYPVRINNLNQITGVNMSTVCFPNGTGFQCRCEDQYRWSCDQCVSYGKCDDITSDTCGCINAIPTDGQYCQSVLHQNFTACPTTTASPTTVPTVPPTLYEYMIEIELNTTDVTVIDQLRAILRNAIYPVRINNLTQITGVNMSTVCFPNATGFQCRCEDQYRWSCDQCVSFGNCDDITSDTCGCINAIPPDGQYCQSVLHQNFTACPTTTASPTTVPTVPPTLYEYMIEIELNTTDVTVIDQLRAILRNAIYPVRINNLNQITGVNMSTVCFPNGTGFQCRCEDQYRWSCDQCVSYGKCDDITSDTCGCINAIPTDGQYCQSVLHQNFTACPTTTASPTTVPTVPPTLYEYMIEIELNTTDVTVIDQLRAILRNAIYPVRINNLTQITGVNMSTVCFPNATGFQCRCEDQYRWSCDQCVSFGNCDDITSDTCGCINAIPPDGQYCQSVLHQNFTACPTTTASPTTVPTVPPTLYEYMIEIELNTTDVTVIDQLRAILRNAIYPVRINNLNQITGVNMSTVCFPNGTGFQCRCEDQYRWSCDQCVSYGKCDDITSDTCGCINAIPTDGQYCQSVLHQNFTACPTTTASPTTVPTVPPTLYEYMMEIEVNTTDVTVIDQLRAILRNAIYPVRINNLTQITGVNMSTVCFPNGTGFQCRCEDQYRWSCDQCVSYGKCDDITSDTCGCINAIPPDGQYCQSVLHQNFTACPTTTASPTTDSTTPEASTTEQITTVDNTTQLTTVTNSTTPEASTTEQITTVDNTTQLITVTNSTTPEASTTEQITTVDNTTQLITVTNSTTPEASTTEQITTVDNTTQLITVTNSTTPEASTTEQITTVDNTTQLITVTNSTTPEASTTEQITTVDNTTQLITVTNSTTPEASTTEQITTVDNTTQLITVTNSTTPEASTTEQITTVDNTTQLITVTNSTTPEASTTEQITTVDNTTQLTTVTNSTTPEASTTEQITTIDNTTQLTTVTNSTTPEASTTEQITTVDNTTQLTTVTNSTTPEASTTEQITTVDNTTQLITVTNSTTSTPTTEQITTADPTTQLTTVDNTTQLTTVDNTTQLNPVTNSTTPEASTTEQITTVDNTTQLTTVTNSTTPEASTTEQITTVDNTTQLITFTNSTTPEASTTEQITTVDNTTQLITVTNSTTPEASTTEQITTVDNTTQLITVTNSTTPEASTTEQITTVDNTTQLITVTNSTTSTPTTEQITTADPTTQLTTVDNTTQLTTVDNTTQLNPVTNSTTPEASTTEQITTVDNTTQLTTVTNSTTPEASTTEQMTKVTNSTTTPPTTGQSTTADPTTQLTTITNFTTPAATTNQTTTVDPTTQPTTDTRTTVTTEPPPATTKTTPPTTIPPTTPPTTVPPPTTIPPPTPPTPPTTTPPTPPTTTPPSTTKPADILLLAMSFKMNEEFTNDLNDKNSVKYKKYRDDIEPVIQAQYRKNMPGFISAALTSFSRGSVIANFDVKTTAADPTAINKANAGLATSLPAVYQVDISSFNIIYSSSTVLRYKPTTIYTDGTMTLECGPPPDTVKMGTIKSVEWKRKGRVLTSTGRFTINTDDFASKKTTLGIKNVIADDKGEYECTLKSDEIYFYQMGQIDIKDAPIIQTKTEINTKCVPGNNQPLECCVQTPYKLMWKEGNVVLLTNETSDNCIQYKYQIQNCDVSSKVVKLTCQVKDPTGYEKTTKLTIFVGVEICNNLEYGSGQEKDTSVAPCKKGEDGIKTAICKSGLWIPQTDTCVLTAINELLTSSQDLKEATVEEFLTKLNNTAVDLKEKIVSSSATISTIVDILRIVASVSKNISQSEIKNILETVNVLVSDEAKESWVFLNADQNKNTSSSLLGSMEFFAGSLPTTSFNVTTKLIQLNQDTFDNSFSTNLNSSVLIEIPETNSKHLTITTLTFHTLRNVLPARNGSNQSANDNTINGVVVMVKLNGTTKNVSLSFDKFNKSLTFNPQCVFWNFSLFNSLGGWDDTGCKLKSNEKGKVTCHCNHLTSFSILMSTSIPKEIQDALDIITYVGVGISMGSLVICLIIEACVWKAMTRNNTSYMRHVSIVNIAVSLLIADIWFIIGASISKNTLENPGEDTRTPIPACTAATFFIHFFYLALFFWMLISGLLLFYRTILVFSHMSKSTMLAIGFSVGYGAPLIIAVVTVAATAPSGGYIKENQACWLNWDKTMALLAFVIPALTIVVINFLILIVVLYKMLRRGVGDATQPDERNAVVVIARCLAILTPFFGLTWGLGVGTMIDPTNKGIHVVFALFNSLQGFFVLVFGTLLDGKIRSAIVGTFSSILPGSDRTRSTSGGAATSSTSALNFIRRRIRRNVYNVSEVANSSNSTGATESFINT